MSTDSQILRKRGKEQEINGEQPPPYSETYHQIPPNGNQVVILQQMFYEEPVRVICQHCGADIVTSTRYKNGTATWLAAAVMCFIGLGFGCCLIPFCMKGAKDVIHSCPKCRRVVGHYSRIGE
ncbi:LITAF domain-containing protein-like [Mytilus trossulus]|uniref:LITAF domain-containing protein-like n=1 Tax=Mytilus trossulus TaxID=6551 RepID=UPI0030072F7F